MKSWLFDCLATTSYESQVGALELELDSSWADEIEKASRLLSELDSKRAGAVTFRLRSNQITSLITAGDVIEVADAELRVSADLVDLEATGLGDERISLLNGAGVEEMVDFLRSSTLNVLVTEDLEDEDASEAIRRRHDEILAENDASLLRQSDPAVRMTSSVEGGAL